MYPSSSPKSIRQRILVIRLGALGDLVLCFQAFADIRGRHPDAEIALLTMPAYEAFAKSMPWFDRVLIDARAPVAGIGAWFNLVKQIRDFAPSRVYDLQGKFRQNILYVLLGGPFGPKWSGAAPLCAWPRPWPPTPGAHFTDFVAAQLRSAGVPASSPYDLAWLDAPIDGFKLPQRYALLIPGCGAGRDYKRWPPSHYAALAKALAARGIASVAIGTQIEGDAINAIARDVPGLFALTGRTSLHQLVALARHAVCVIGNDTGPTHLAAATGALTLALLPQQIDPLWSAPRGARAHWLQGLQGKPLASLTPGEVLLALDPLLDKNA